MTVTHLNPERLLTHPAFSQGVQVSRGASLLVVGGQNGVDAEGVVVSPDFGAQTEQALRNVLAVLAEAGATQADVVKLTIYIVVGNDIEAGFMAAQNVWGPHPTAISVLQVAGLALPDCLVEIDAVAAVPDGDA